MLPGLEKLRLAWEMATRWTDATIVLVGLLPALFLWIYLTLKWTFGFLYSVLSLTAFFWPLFWMVLPTLLVIGVYTLVYHKTFFMQDLSVDTSKYVTFTSAKDAAYWKHRPIPMCELYEFYISERCSFNPECEGGDCYLILNLHRDKFVNYKVTYGQVIWLLSQFVPASWIPAGLGLGNSSDKSIEATTKEIDEHYNKGNDVFSCIMGKRMVYTSAVFHKIPEFASSGHNGDYAASAADGTLEEAQDNKMSMLCDKVMLQEGESILDIGCGWGTLARHARKHYKANATGVTLSSEGKIYCDLASKKEKVPTEILHCDYREIPTDRKFDKITSIEMAEHVGIANFVDPYLTSVKNLMAKKDSKFLMQVAGLRQGSNWQDVAWGLFMSRYIFPGADASTPLNWYIRQCELAGFEVHSVENLGQHYSHTLHKWYDNWMSHKDDILTGKIDAISEHSKGAHLFRLNEFFLAWSTIASGRSSAIVYQILMHPCEADYPRDQWVDAEHVSGTKLVGVGMNHGANGEAKKKD
jgi:cyclopropane fatty-acyl-phospholipid synthase-like methyltransferase